MKRPRRALTFPCMLALLCLVFSASAQGQETWADAMKASRAYQALEKQGKYREALPYAQRVVDIVRKVKGENDPDYAAGLNNLALLYKTMGEYAKAEPLYKQALEIFKNELGDSHLFLRREKMVTVPHLPSCPGSSCAKCRTP